jgi:hypothetical protein
LAEFHRAELNWFAQGQHCRSFLELDPQDSQCVLWKASADPIPLEPFSLLISEILHNLRSGLDSLAFALALAHYRPHDLPNRMAEDSQFPIAGDVDRQGRDGQGPTMFKNRAHQICGMHPKAQEVIKSFPAVSLGANFREHKLWTLVDLSNRDKHHLLPRNGRRRRLVDELYASLNLSAIASGPACN